jgi:hypothetical protein
VNGGGFSGGTELVVWRDTKTPAGGPIACEETPSWLPLVGAVTVQNERGLATYNGGGSRFSLATQKVKVGSAEIPIAEPFGRLTLDLNHSAGGMFDDVAQGWVSVAMSAEGQYSLDLPAHLIGRICGASASP